ncbi:MAG: nucleoside hydrolase, partial [Asticcacaulis sp.]|nr:nucleoside hydrolase [Asticcacaulis sp.]
SEKIDAEYNVKTDPKALQTVFAAEWLSCAITPLDTCGLVNIDGDDWQALRASSDPFARACIANSEIWLPNAPWMPKDFDLTKQSSTQFDSVAVTMAYDESDLVMETLPLRVTDDGMTVIDEANGRPVRVATEWRDLARFKRKMVADLTSRPV